MGACTIVRVSISELWSPYWKFATNNCIVVHLGTSKYFHVTCIVLRIGYDVRNFGNIFIPKIQHALRYKKIILHFSLSKNIRVSCKNICELRTYSINEAELYSKPIGWSISFNSYPRTSIRFSFQKYFWSTSNVYLNLTFCHAFISTIAIRSIIYLEYVVKRNIVFFSL